MTNETRTEKTGGVSPPASGVRFGQFRRLIDHAAWDALPPAPGDDVQGPDVRDRIGKEGVVFSAYPIPRGPGHFGEVALDPLPGWAQAAGLPCSIPVEDLCTELGFSGDPDRGFEFLSSRLQDVKSFLAGDRFARRTVDRAIELLNQRYSMDKEMFYELRPQIGMLGLTKALIAAYVSRYNQKSRYRRALRS